MTFSVGDKIIHPKFGAGQIMGEEHRELVAGFEHYYVIQLHRSGATAYVPVCKMDELGVRPVMSRTKLTQVLKTLRSTPRRLSKDFKKRQARIREKLQTGLPLPIAEAVRDLTWHGKRAHLTQKDEDLLGQGRELLAVEMAMATDGEVLDIHETIDTELQTALARVADDAEPSQGPEGALVSASTAPARAGA